MLIQIILSLLFILPLFGSMSVLFKAVAGELKKKNIEDQKVSTVKIIGFSVLSAIGFYIALFLIWLIWIPNFDLPYSLKIVSYCLAAPYLLGVIGISVALKKATEFGASPSKMANAVSDSVSKS
jgi:Na+/H+ antiporter NhaA